MGVLLDGLWGNGARTLARLLGVATLSPDGICPSPGPAVQTGCPVNQVSHLPAYLFKGRCAGLLHLVHRLGFSGDLAACSLLLHQPLAKLGRYLAMDVPLWPSAALAFDLIVGAPFPRFWHDRHLRFASHGEINFST